MLISSSPGRGSRLRDHLLLVPYRRIAALTLLGSSVLAAALLVVVYLLFRAVVSRALRPVEAMAQQAARWSAHDVDGVDGGRASSNGHPVRVSVSRLPIDDSDLAVGIDDAVLERVLAPLVDNALRYARQSISVQVAGSSRTVEIDIADDGPGIPDAALPHLFEPGWRGEPNGAHDGAGLGLALARRLAVAAGGSLTAATTAAGPSSRSPCRAHERTICVVR